MYAQRCRLLRRTRTAAVPLYVSSCYTCTVTSRAYYLRFHILLLKQRSATVRSTCIMCQRTNDRCCTQSALAPEGALVLYRVLHIRCEQRPKFQAVSSQNPSGNRCVCARKHAIHIKYLLITRLHSESDR